MTKIKTDVECRVFNKTLTSKYLFTKSDVMSCAWF